jgi:hypothetical protein
MTPEQRKNLKVGDKIRHLTNGYRNIEKGSIWKVIKADVNGTGIVILGGGGCWECYASEWDLVEERPFKEIMYDGVALSRLILSEIDK